MRGPSVILAAAALAWSAPAEAQAPTVAPRLDAVRSGADVLLVWGVVPADEYEVWRADDPAGPFGRIAVVTATTYTDVDTVAGPPANPVGLYYLVVPVLGGLPGPASNMAFKRNVDLVHEPSPVDVFGRNRVSFPFRYFPSGIVGSPALAREVCAENAAIRLIVKFDPGSCLPRVQSCTLPFSVFTLAPGEAYGIVVTAPTTLDVVGAHDPAYEPGGGSLVSIEPCDPPCTMAARSLISVPYHSRSDSAGDLCGELARTGAPVLAVEDFRLDVDRPWRHVCGLAATDFPLVRGRGYEVQLAGDALWQPEVWR